MYVLELLFSECDMFLRVAHIDDDAVWVVARSKEKQNYKEEKILHALNKLFAIDSTSSNKANE